LLLKTWQRLLIWLGLLVVAALVLPGVDPLTPILLGVLLIAGFELGTKLIRRLPNG
jgi:Sec-independent protein secretion pathway component TatC